MISAHPTPALHPLSPEGVDADIVTAAINAAAVASVAYQEELERFRYVMTLGVRHGAPLGDLARAAGITCEQATQLLDGGRP